MKTVATNMIYKLGSRQCFYFSVYTCGNVATGFIGNFMFNHSKASWLFLKKKKNQVLCISWHNLIRLAVGGWSGAQCSGACQHVQGAVSHPEHRRRQQQLLCQACESQKRPCRQNKAKPENKQNHTEKFHVKWNFHEFLFYHTFKNATVWLDRFDSPVDLHTSQISLGNGEAEASTFQHMRTANSQHQNL